METMPTNPYASPEDMQIGQAGNPSLTRRELRVLQIYRKWLQRRPTMVELLPRFILYWFVYGCAFAAGVYLLRDVAENFDIPVSLLLLGIFLGVVLRDIRWLRGTVHSWPIIARVIDQNAINRLLEGQPK